MRRSVDAINKSPHPEGAGEAGVSKDARRSCNSVALLAPARRYASVAAMLRNFYAFAEIDRAGHRRRDAAWLSERLAHADTRFLRCGATRTSSTSPPSRRAPPF